VLGGIEDAAGDEGEAVQQACACKGVGGEKEQPGFSEERQMCARRAAAAARPSARACALCPIVNVPRSFRQRAGRQADRTEEARHEWLMVDVRCCLCFCVRRVVVCEGLKRKPGKRLCKSQSKSVVHMACLVVSWLANETREL